MSIYSGHSFGFELHPMHRTDLVDNGKDGVDEHQVVLLDGQVVSLLQGEQHRSNQGDLCGAEQKKKKRPLVIRFE